METITVTAPPLAGLEDTPTLDQSVFADGFPSTTDPNGGAGSTGNTSWLGNALQWVGQTADEVTNATYSVQDAARATQAAYAQANQPQPKPVQSAPGRLSQSQVNGIGLVILLIGAIVLFTHGG